MLPIFGAIGIAGTGATVSRKWLDAISDNIANLNTVRRTSEEAYQERFILAQPAADGNGAQVGGVLFGDGEGRLVYEPDHPLADANGYVRYPDIDLSEQMGQMILAQRGYQANLAVVDRAKTAYEAALQLGRGA
jgi:flagellar basal-body rod protein FlgC